jgi:hypothetical protein
MADALEVVTIVGKRSSPVTKGLVTADDFYLEKINIVTPKNIVNIKSVFVELSYYEDIFRGTVSGHVLISDSISMIDRLGLSGNDFLELKFRKSKLVEEGQSISKYFRIYRVGERILNNSETESYALHFCSEELFLSEQTKVSKAYDGKTIKEIVTDILNKHMQIDEKYLTIESTEGLYDFVIPYKKPFDAINWLANYAIPTEAETVKGADFVFFENSGGFNFRSLQSLFTSRIYNNYIYSQKNVDNLGNKGSLGRDLSTIKSYTFLDTFDTLYGTVSGAFANRLITIDPLTRRYTDTKFDYVSDYQDKLNDKEKNSLINNAQNRLGKTANQNYDAVLKVMTTNANQKTAVGILDKPHTVANDIRVEKYVPYRTAQLALSHYVRIKLTISGDPNLTVGTTINVELPSSASNKDGSGLNEGLTDQQYSGKYLITSVRHIVSSQMKYETVLEVVKDGYKSSLSNFKDTKKLADTIKGQR